MSNIPVIKDREPVKFLEYLGFRVTRTKGRLRAEDGRLTTVPVHRNTEAIGFTYGRQALPMLWDYVEMCPYEHPSGWYAILNETLENLSTIPSVEIKEMRE